MKNISVPLLMSLLMAFADNAVQAQVYYHFIYVEHEIGDHKNILCEKLKNVREDALETGDVLIIYLSTGDQEQDFGICSYTNLEDPSGKGQDTEDAFNSIIAIIQDNKSLPVNAQADVRRVREILDDSNFISDNGDMKYRKAEIDFYVGSRFWRLGFNNKVIAHLYSILGLSYVSKSEVEFRVFVPKTDDKLKYAEGKPFGENNIDGINEKITLRKY